MTDQAAAFLRAIIEQPDDDLPRLVYADWLDEHGEPERAEFIRVQCRMASLTDNCTRDDCQCPRCLSIAALRDREWELWTKHGVGWLAGTPLVSLDSIVPGDNRVVWRRGFVEEVRMAWNRARIAAIRQAAPLRKVVLTTWPNRAWVVERHRGRHVPIGLFGRIQVDATRDAIAAEFPGLEFELPSIGIAVDAA